MSNSFKFTPDNGRIEVFIVEEKEISHQQWHSIVLAPNIRSSDLFIKFEGNSNGGNVDQSFRQALESNESQISFDALQNAHSSINRVYVLCGNRTASSSELIINNLKP
ncbi:hypothetical protein [Flavobacterium sp. 1]|uniref:hypothetical protein n=1 Tax=Flavobacterium sp. 1 TaxID=2035200 RepID=UPI0018E2859E|nr:hypothetical protein [Flavobacterium sp. 1]